jgi:pyruvate-formate lyase-activating enzyme
MGMKQMSKPVVFYGAGEHPAKVLGENPVIQECPPPPALEEGVCFVDSNIAKQGTTYLGLPVLSLDTALSQYSDASFYLTVGDVMARYEICSCLTDKGIEAARIINYPRLSCQYLDNYVVCGYHEGAFDGKAGRDCGTHSLKSCCSDYGKNNVEIVPIQDDLAAAFNAFIKLRENTMKSLNHGKPTRCDGCPELTPYSAPAPLRFSYIRYNELGICNCKCRYCNYHERLGRNTENDADLIQLFKLVQEYGFDNDKGVIELCNGEITIYPRKAEVYEALKGNIVRFLTNGILHDEEIQRRLTAGTGILDLSLDCGTRDTFKIVKGIDAFEKVAENLRRYSKGRKGQLYLKYIVLPGINDNHADIDGFIDLCVELDVTLVLISRNLCLSYEDYDNEQTIKAVKYMIDRLRLCSIPFEVYSKNIINKLIGKEIEQYK